MNLTILLKIIPKFFFFFFFSLYCLLIYYGRGLRRSNTNNNNNLKKNISRLKSLHFQKKHLISTFFSKCNVEIKLIKLREKVINFPEKK